MTPVFGSRRRADEFDALLSRSSAGSLDDASQPYADLLAVVATMRATPPPAPRADFSAALRERLVLAAETALAPDSAEQVEVRRAPAPRRSPRERRLAAAVGGFAIVSATASMAVAAQSSLPGDTLYPLKRAIENAQAGVQQDADGKGTTLLGNAAGRLDEVGALSQPGDDDAGDAEAISTTLQDFVDQATEASDLLLSDYSSTGQASSIEELRTFTADSMGALTSLQSVIPEAARASLITATQLVNAIDVQAQRLCPACTDLPLIEAPAFATRAVETLLDEALTPLLEPLAPATPASDGAKPAPNRSADRPKDRTPKPEQRPGSSPAPSGTAPATPEQPSAPQLPTAPPSGDGGKGGGSKDGGLLEDLNIKGSDDPLGDLLTGTTETVDEVVDGVLGGLGDLGKLGR
jgi:hypothetical protein